MTERGEVGQGSAAATERGESSAVLGSPDPQRLVHRRVVGDNSGLVLMIMEASQADGPAERDTPLGPDPLVVEESGAAKASSPVSSASRPASSSKGSRTQAAKHDNGHSDSGWVCNDCGFRSFG